VQVEDQKNEIKLLTKARLESLTYANDTAVEYGRQVEERTDKLKKAEYS
jgi:hypothetical protein